MLELLMQFFEDIILNLIIYYLKSLHTHYSPTVIIWPYLNSLLIYYPILWAHKGSSSKLRFKRAQFRGCKPFTEQNFRYYLKRFSSWIGICYQKLTQSLRKTKNWYKWTYAILKSRLKHTWWLKFTYIMTPTARECGWLGWKIHNLYHHSHCHAKVDFKDEY